MSRIAGWPGFINRTSWELVSENTDAVAAIVEALGKKAVFVTDVKGMVTARIIAMIINEAYYALGEGVSSKEEIDLAMKLGTNYPYGPFEWSEKIGLDKIFELLKSLSEDDIRYVPAPALIAQLKNKYAAAH